MADLITYEDKIATKVSVNRVNECHEDDLNQLKTGVNKLSNAEAGPITYDPIEERNQSLLPFYAPLLISDPGTAILGNLELSSANHTLAVKNQITGVNRFVPVQRFNDAGASPIRGVTLNPISVVLKRSLDNELQPSDSQSYTVTYDNNYIFKEAIYNPSETGVITLTMRSNDADGGIISIQGPFPVTADDVASGEVVIPLSNIILQYTGDVIHYTIEGVKLWGGTSVDAPYDGEWKPWFKSNEWDILSFDNLITDKDYTPADVVSKYESVDDVNRFDDAAVAKLASVVGGRSLGVFATLVALQTAYPVGELGDNAIVTAESNHQFYWSGTAWVDSGTSAGGDMFSAEYDPSGRHVDVFSMGNMVDTATKVVMITDERDKLAGVGDGANKNVQADYTQTDSGSDSFIKNKLTDLQVAAKYEAVAGVNRFTDEYKAVVDAASTGAQKVYYAESLPESNTAYSWVNKVTLNLPAEFEAGDYFIEVGYGWRMNSYSAKFQSRIMLDSTDVGFLHLQEPQDSYNQQVAFRRFKKSMTAGVHTVELDYGDYNGGTAYIWDASITVTRIDIQ